VNAEISKQVSRLLRSGKVSEAIAMAQDCASTLRRDPEAQSALAHALLFARRYEEALEAASAAIALDEFEPALRFLRSRILFIEGERRAAIEDCQAAIRQSELSGSQYYSESCYLLMAASHVTLGEAEQARAALEHVGGQCAVMVSELVTRDGVLHKLDANARPSSRRPRL
jgi:tetratricopeptide (TPR) repeat protein